MSFYAISFYIYLCLVGTFNKEKALVVVVGPSLGPVEGISAFCKKCNVSKVEVSVPNNTSRAVLAEEARGVITPLTNLMMPP